MSRTCLFHISGNRFQPFPMAHHTYRIWKELAQGFDEYHVIARGEKHVYVHCREGNIHLHLLPRLSSHTWIFYFLSWLLPIFVWRYRPTHLLAQCPVMGGVAAAVCSKIFNIPLLVELHGAHYFNKQWTGWHGWVAFRVYKFLTKLTFMLANRIRCLSGHMKESVLACYGVMAYEKAIVIPNRVDLKVFRHIKSSYALSGPVKIITIGSYIPIKNHMSLIEDLCRSDISFTLTLVGDGPLLPEYIDLARRYAIEDRIIVTGRLTQDKIAEILVEHDFYVHYAISEGVPRAVLEAMAAALPVIVTPVGFISDVLFHGENAIVLDGKCDSSLSEAIKELMSSNLLREKLGRSARNTIENRFEWNRVFDEYRDSILSLRSVSDQ